MSTLELSPRSVDAYTKLLTNPAEYKLPFQPIGKCFVKSDKVTAKHILAKAYMEHVGPNLPKLMCYIVMDAVFGICNGKDEQGRLGYYLEFKLPADV